MNQSKPFSEYLVEQGLVTADDLVEILISQTRQLPTPAELVRQHKLLSAKQLLAVFSHQMKTSVDFSTACRELGLWTPEFQKLLQSENERLRIPIVQILQSSGKVSTEDLVSALDSFLSEAATKPNFDAPQASADAPLESDGDSSNDHFKEYYSDTLQARMIALANEWDQSNSQATDVLVDGLHGLVGAARFSKLSEIEDLFKTAETNIRALADCATPLPQVAIETFRKELVQSLEKAWSLRDGSVSEIEVAV